MNFPPDIGTGSQLAASVGRIVRGVPGREVHVARPNTQAPTGHIATITASNGTDEATYQMRVRGSTGLDVTVTAVADASSAQGARDPLLAAAQADPLLMAYLKRAAGSSTNAIVLEAIDGVTLTVTFPTNPSTHLSVGYTAAAAAPQYLFGRAVEVVAATLPAGMTGEGIRQPVAIDGAVLDLTHTHDGSGEYSIVLSVDGVAKHIAWSNGADQAATDALAVTALEAADYIADADIESAGVITVTGMPGVDITVISASAVGGAAAIALSLDTAADELPRFALVIDDRATPMLDSLPQTDATGPLIGSAPLTADQSGSTIYAVEAPGTSISGTTVYVETDDSAGNEGRLYDTPSATRTPWLEPKWVGLDADNASYAHIRF
jgi:hypothetical protein